MFEFAYPYLLFLLLLIPLLWWYIRHVRKEPSFVVSNIRPFRNVKRKKFIRLSDLFYLLGAAALIIAAARPRTGDEKVMIRSKGIDIVLALDMSGSMQAIDVPGNIGGADELIKQLREGKISNRLETAKKEIRQFILARPNDRIGLLGFADLAYSFSPPTLDHSWLLERLSTLEPGQLGDATGIAAPIAAGVRKLKSSPAPRRVLVLFTDGTNTAENRLTPEQSAALAKDFDVIIHTVGIGSDNAYVLAEGYGFQKMQGNFDEKLLQNIASMTGGTYFRAADGNGMKEVMSRINALEKTNIEQPRFVEYREYAPAAALTALFLLLAGFVIEHTWKLRLP